MLHPYPSKRQLEFLDWEMGIFFHFGIRTFYEGRRDWDELEMPSEAFCPESLDCEQWLRISSEAGFRYAVLVCKHHDGFANWPSQYTNYSVASTPWKHGQGDVVAEFTSACRKYGIKIGLYYSPAQFHFENENPVDYDDYFIHQISELLTNYGTIDYLWFDACGSENHSYDTVRIIREIRRLQPEILIFNLWDPDTRWIGNEAGLAPRYHTNYVSNLDFSVQTDQKQQLEQMCFLPAECDCRIRRDNWFYSDSDESTVKSPQELMGLYDYSVGRGANFLLNVGPDRRGLIPEKDAAVLLEFGNQLKKRFAHPIPTKIIPKTQYVCCVVPAPQPISCVVLQEDLHTRDMIEDFSIEVLPHGYGEPICVYRGQTVGHKAICSFPPVHTGEVRILTSRPQNLRSIQLYFPKY